MPPSLFGPAFNNPPLGDYDEDLEPPHAKMGDQIMFKRTVVPPADVGGDDSSDGVNSDELEDAGASKPACSPYSPLPPPPGGEAKADDSRSATTPQGGTRQEDERTWGEFAALAKKDPLAALKTAKPAKSRAATSEAARQSKASPGLFSPRGGASGSPDRHPAATGIKSLFSPKKKGADESLEVPRKDPLPVAQGSGTRGVAVRRRVALVTCGTRGVGSVIAEVFAENGHDLLLGHEPTDNTAPARADELRRKHGAKVVLVGGDVTAEETLEKYVVALQTELGGRLHACVHTSMQVLQDQGLPASPQQEELPARRPSILGSPMRRASSAASPEPLDASTPPSSASAAERGGGGGGGAPLDWGQFELSIKLHSRAFAELMERALSMMGDGDGAVIGVAAPAASPRSPTVAGRMAMEQTARHYARQSMPRGVTVNVLLPAYERDPTNAEAMAREVGHVALFLCGPHARKISGVSLPVDGGQHLIT